MAFEPNKGTPNDFLTSFLLAPASFIPKGAQWAILFSDLDSILPSITKAYSFEPSGSGEWKTEAAARAILTPEYQKDKGCMFCQAIALPGDGLNTNIEGNIGTSGGANAFIRSYVGGGRNNFPTMRMSFLDTNASFCDSFLRGWALATANFGMINYYGVPKYRTTLDCFKFGIRPEGPFILQKYSFNGVCCISVSEEEYTYQPQTAAVLREAQFVYHSYSIDNTLLYKPNETDFVPSMAQSSQAAAEGMDRVRGAS